MTEPYYDECNLSVRRKKRSSQTAEFFTPPLLVRDILEKLPEEVWEDDKTFLDPACGNGNFLIAVLWRKVERGHSPLDALKTIYGVDIMRDNIQECRLRLLKVAGLYEDITEEHVQSVFMNIVYVNSEKHKGGALDYDFKFNSNKQSKENLQKWLQEIKDSKLREVQLPVEETAIYPKCGWIDFEDE